MQIALLRKTTLILIVLHCVLVFGYIYIDSFYNYMESLINIQHYCDYFEGSACEQWSMNSYAYKDKLHLIWLQALLFTSISFLIAFFQKEIPAIYRNNSSNQKLFNGLFSIALPYLILFVFFSRDTQAIDYRDLSYAANFNFNNFLGITTLSVLPVALIKAGVVLLKSYLFGISNERRNKSIK